MSEKRRMQKRSVTLAAETAEGVEYFVGEGGAESFSAAINEAAERWVADQRLGVMLEDLFQRHPDSRPSEADLARARAQLQEAADRAAATRQEQDGTL